MSLFGSIQMAGNTLQANDIALQVVGQNIANANTPGYLREVTNFETGPTQQVGNVVLGTGTKVLSVTQQVNQFLEQQLRGANSDQANSSALQSAYTTLETSIGALSSTGSVGSSLTSFFNSISNVLNQPGNNTALTQVVSQAQSLTQGIQNLDSQVSQQRSNLDSQIQALGNQINTLVTGIAQLNQQIIQFGPGKATQSDVVGLTDQRQQDLDSLSNIVGIQTLAQTDGSVNVYVGGDYLVDGSITQSVDISESANRGITVSTIQLANTNTPLQSSTGQLAGLTTARDTVLGGFQDQLDNFSASLTNEFNKVYASGQGTVGYSSVSSLNAVNDPDQSLDGTGLNLTPVNGSFDITTTNQQTGLATTTNIPVSLLGSGHDTTLNTLAAEINGVSGLQATVANGKLSIASTSPNLTFAFSNDNSNTLAALGINTFFTGTSGHDISVNSTVVQNVNLFAASQGGVGVDTNNALQLANFGSQPLASQGGNTITGLYSDIVNNVSQNSASATAAATSANTVQQTLSAQELSVSGVNIDEETVNLLQYQEAYAASAKYISTLNTLLTDLIQL
jgi:flagellar hook-associated protein 1 FlgK